MLVTCYQALGREQDFRRVATIELERAEKILAQDRNNARVLAHAGLALSALGQEERARQMMNRALLIDPNNVNMLYNFACSMVMFPDGADAALDMLSQAFAKAGSGLVEHSKIDPDLDPLRESPRFKAIIAEAEARLAQPAAAGG
jgi:adenylate cyclase